jgi:hypothetical protein
VDGLAARRQPLGERAHHRRLAGAADRQVADADHRHAGIEGDRARDPPRRHRRPDPRNWRQQGADHRHAALALAIVAHVPPARRGELHAGNSGAINAIAEVSAAPCRAA